MVKKRKKEKDILLMISVAINAILIISFCLYFLFFKTTIKEYDNYFRLFSNSKNLSNSILTTYDQYLSYMSLVNNGEVSIQSNPNSSNIDKQTFTNNNVLVVVDKAEESLTYDGIIEKVSIKNKIATVTIKRAAEPFYFVEKRDVLYFIIIDKQTINEIKVAYACEEGIVNPGDGPDNVVFKPIIYLYPKKAMMVNIKLSNPMLLTHSYPKYNDGWNVLANPNGDLIDLTSKRNLYALYWEGIDESKINVSEGFIVKGSDTANFLEEKLALLGLNDREANEFIIYWLPKMENNKYNYIRFRTTSEINNYMDLVVNPKPDTIIRVYMDYKALKQPVKVNEQHIVTPERKGFTLVEWGGRQIK